MSTDIKLTLRQQEVLRAVARGEIVQDGPGVYLRRYPSGAVTVVNDFLRLKFGGLVDGVTLTDAGRAWLDAHPAKEGK